jgi:hypothetical protein
MKDSRYKIPPGFSPIMPNPELFFGPLEATKRTFPAGCFAGRVVYTMHVALPDNVTTVKLPDPIKRGTPQFTFREEWTRDGLQLRRRTEVASVVTTHVCSPADVDAVRTAFRAIGQRTYPMVSTSRGGPEASGPSLLQQLFGAKPAAHARPDAATAARSPTPPTAVRDR